MNDRSVCVMGLGYIGLPTASVLATKGFTVLGVDVKPDIIDTINRGEVHIVEPDLHRLVHAAVDSGLLKAGLEPKPAQTFIIAVPTPFEEIKGEKIPDLSYIEGAVDALAPHLKENNLIVLESTSPVGTTELIAKQISSLRPDLLDEEGQALKLQIAHCPERVLPGKILQEIIENDRIVGGIDEASTQKAAQFYRTFVRGAVITTNSRTAEMAKLVENSFRDTNIAFANELSMLCDELEIDVWELIQLANRHPRVNILNPGPGVGGHCLAVDPWFIVSRAPKQAKLIRQARKVNEYKPHYIVKKIKSCADRLRSPIIGCMGLSYKPNIDDLRESPALEVTRALIKELPEAKILACEPNIRRLDGVTLVSLDELLRRSDVVVGLVAHDTFRIVSRARLEGKMVIDTCGMFH